MKGDSSDMAEYGEWNRKGAVLSDVTAQKEYGVTRDFIVTITVSITCYCDRANCSSVSLADGKERALCSPMART
jgi:hypothetical protein